MAMITAEQLRQRVDELKTMQARETKEHEQYLRAHQAKEHDWALRAGGYIYTLDELAQMIAWIEQKEQQQRELDAAAATDNLASLAQTDLSDEQLRELIEEKDTA